MKRRYDFSQNFLRDPRFVRELIGHTTIKPSDVVYDIGAGSGVITSALAERCKHVIAVELEPKTVEILQKNMAKYTNVTIIHANFLEMTLPNVTYKVFANIPFHLSSPILKKITTAYHPPVCSYLIVQKQFANKLLPDYEGFSSQLGMVLGVRFYFKVRKRLHRTDFWPRPNVDTVLLEISLRDIPLIPKSQITNYENFVQACFTDPRVFSKVPLQKIGKPKGSKPSSLTLSDWISLFTGKIE